MRFFSNARLFLLSCFIVSALIVCAASALSLPPSSSAVAQHISENPERHFQGGRTPREREPEPATEGTPSISASVDLVSIQVLVSDSKGNVLTGLRPENFTIYEDNVKQEILHFSPVQADATIVLLLEYSRKISNFLGDVWNAVIAFTRSLRSGDWVAVIGYDLNTNIISDFTQNRSEIYNALGQFTIPVWNESNLSDAIVETLDMTQDIEGKVAIVLIGTGLDTMSRVSYPQALERAKSANASIYAIGMGQQYRLYAESQGWLSDNQHSDYLMGDNRLRSFADLTGGASYFPRFTSELPNIFDTISRLIRSQYSISYTSTNKVKDGKFRQIRVEVSTELTDDRGRPLKLTVSTRKGYIPK
ncbi:MAG TPA: VWA domain-containing protein [Acidobacteriota bacterium]|nr:VWA domain-containing protein [Acidobacteriota bacterium]